MELINGQLLLSQKYNSKKKHASCHFFRKRALVPVDFYNIHRVSVIIARFAVLHINVLILMKLVPPREQTLKGRSARGDKAIVMKNSLSRQGRQSAQAKWERGGNLPFHQQFKNNDCAVLASLCSQK